MTPDAAWLAGLIVGEGTISLYKPKAYLWVSYVLSVANTHRETIEEAKRIVSEICGREIRYRTIRQSRDGYRPLYILKVTKQSEVVAVINTTFDRLIGKQDQAKLMLRSIELAPGRGHDTDPEVLAALVSEMRHLNRRYAKGVWHALQQEAERQAPTMGEETVQ